MATLQQFINGDEEREFYLKSNDFLRPPLKQIGNSIFDIKRYFISNGGILTVPSSSQPPLAGIKSDLFDRLEKTSFLYSTNIVTGTVIPQIEDRQAFVFLSESLGVALDFPVLQRPGHLKCDAFIAIPHQPVLILTIVDGDRESEVARSYNTHVITKVTITLRKFLDENINLIGGVLSLTDLTLDDDFKIQVEKYSRLSSFFVTERSLSMNLSKYEKVLQAFWAGVAEAKVLSVRDEEDNDYLRFLTKEQCIVLVENINSKEVSVTSQRGCGASTLMLEVARRLSNLEETLLVCGSEEERDRLKLIYPNTVAAADIPNLEMDKFKNVVDETGTVEHTHGRIWQFTKDGNDLKMRVRILEMVTYLDSNQTELQPGDLLKFDRGNFFHYAVYIGEGTVVHQTKDKGVIKQPLKDVIQQSLFYVDNSMDMEIRPKSRRQIVTDALAKVGRQGYDLFTSNCEHFATHCRYGAAKCKQIGQKIKEGVLSVSNSSSSSWTSNSSSSNSCAGSKESVAELFCAGCTSMSKAKTQ